MRFGVIGCGLIGQKRASAAIACGAQVTHVADLDHERAAVLADRVQARIVETWQDVLAADIDAVVIAVTHDHLSPMTLAALAAEKHVLVEKPAGRNAVEVAAVVAAARKFRRKVKVGYNHRFHPAIMKARESCEMGALGPLMYIRGRYGHGGRAGYDREWRCKPEISGGGELIDQGSHLIDLARMFLGDLSLAFAATPTYYWDIPVDDNCFLALRGPSGQMAWLHATWTEWKNMFSFEISGRDGKFVIDGLGGSYGVEKLTYYKMLPQMGPPETTSWEYPFADLSWEREVQEFINAIREDRQPFGNIEDAHAVLTLIDTAYGRNGS
jgi:predicted dehydrogenase